MPKWPFSRKSETPFPEKSEVPVSVFRGESGKLPDSPQGSTFSLNMTDEPDYSLEVEIEIQPEPIQKKYAQIVIIGLGPLGKAVLEDLAFRIPVQVGSGQRPVKLLLLTIPRTEEPDYELTSPPGKLNETKNLNSGEIRELFLDRDVRASSWYSLDARQPLGRPDGRLALFQQLNMRPSLWDTLTNLLNEGNPDVWLVGSTFDAESGALFDLAHLIRLVSKFQNYSPFIGWLLALPGQDWAYSHRAESVAFLRETARLIRHNQTRLFEDYILAQDRQGRDNHALLKHQARGEDDVSTILLHSPEPEVFGEEAGVRLVSKMSLALYTFLQPECWMGDLKLRDRLRQAVQPAASLAELQVSVLGAHAHQMPVDALKQNVRSHLAYESLFNRQWGLLRPWRNDELEEDPTAPRTLLESSGHPLLIQLAGIKNRLDVPARWPDFAQADEVLAETLRQRLQALLERDILAHGLRDAVALLTSIQHFLEDVAFLPEVIVNPLSNVVHEPLNAIKKWGSSFSAFRTQLEAQLYEEDSLWQALFRQPVPEMVIQIDAPETRIKELMSEAPGRNAVSLRERIRRHVRFSWLRTGNKLEVKLDILAPGWKTRNEPYRFPPDPQQLGTLWQYLYQTIWAFTQEPQYWPVGLSHAFAQERSPAEDATRQHAAVYPAYGTGKTQQEVTTDTFMFQLSEDSAWRNKHWFDKDKKVSFLAFSPNIGVLLQIHTPIPILALKDWEGLLDQYYNSRQPGNGLHIFSAEQAALECERPVFQNIPYRHRRDFQQHQLSGQVVDMFEFPRVVEAFVLAWCMGWVTPESGTSVYSLYNTDGATLWKSPVCDHPLEALSDFFKQPDAQKIITPIENMLRKQNPGQQSRVQTIAEWWNSSNEADITWYILVNGFLRRRK